ncbi:hypothetical protein ABLV98_11385 [Staphylococcus sp. 50Mo3-1]|uniref:hypothetical protein n=1 Tax=Staphylococcus sp. 50Mo3-2 TaxID=3135642 RepID=UPI0033D43CF5
MNGQGIGYLKLIAQSLHGIHKELIKLNHTHPANRAEGKAEKPKNTRELDPKDFI